MDISSRKLTFLVSRFGNHYHLEDVSKIHFQRSWEQYRMVWQPSKMAFVEFPFILCCTWIHRSYKMAKIQSKHNYIY